MDRVTLGRTGLTVNKNGFGALPIQRVDMRDAVYILQKAFYYGIDYIDSARSYTDSEEKLGAAFSYIRDKLVISTKTNAKNTDAFWRDLTQSLTNLQTDYIDIYQFHNPKFCPKPGDTSGLYDAMCKARKQGKIRFIGITNHRLSIAKEAAESGLYDTVQFPFSYLSTDADMEIVNACKDRNIGFIAMKALSGGLITDSATAYAYLTQFDAVEPIWGIQRESELTEFLSYQDKPPVFSEQMRRQIERDREELAGDFCRGCGYCMPCPAGIAIHMCARMSLLLRRAPQAKFLSEEQQQEMKKIENCQHCNACVSKCPYGLNTPELLRKNYEDYQTFI
jgi:predicted aldo/keto reductase-like oxidoreductase